MSIHNYFEIYISKTNTFVDIYVTSGPVQAFQKARTEFPELENEDLRAVNAYPLYPIEAPEKHIDKYPLN